ncbi:dynamin family protein [Polaribacter sp. Z014]|uniref:dynamin family protein n=1 Tax=Polaribacter sp. Z014 TaxID=2927126 RepID=UPI0020229A64|nr:dynamin family protein [Polaribacter sp. Z014]MCL7765355.1 dynamin family protein [Polaribacter sp. Z014]
MEEINYLIDIAEFLKKPNLIAELYYIKDRLNSETSELVLPIVGEFSSGKTTFINELTEGKKLETATKPTTSVIYEIYFDNEIEKAEIIFNNNEVKIIEDITLIKNDQLENVKQIKIYDTSKKITNNTILVDTPGLSSNDPKHIEALSNYLPNSDAIFLFSDVNQQVTNSLLDFIKTNNLVHLPLYLVLTKTDTKTKEEIKEIKEYISKNIHLDINNIISISSKKQQLGEFYQLLDKIQVNKNSIINKALKYRLEKVANYLKKDIETLIGSSKSDSNFQEEIKLEKRKLDKTIRAIDNLIEDIKNNIDDIEYEAIKQFENHIKSKLNDLITKNNENIDNQAIGLINSTANLVFSNYQNEIKRKLYTTASERKNTDLINLRSIESVDFSNLQIGQMSYGMNLSEAGQGTIKGITTGIKIAAVIGAVVVTAGAAAAAAGAGTAAAATTAGAAGTAGASGAAVATGTTLAGATATAGAANLASKAGTVISAVDTVSDVASIQSNRSLRKKITQHAQDSGKYIEQYKGHLKTYEEYNTEAGQMINPKQKLGFMEGFVGSATDSVIGKPERKRIINNFLRESLNPEFKSKLTIISGNLLNDMQNSFNQEATITINQIEQHLTELEQLNKNEKENFDYYIKTLKDYLIKLS